MKDFLITAAVSYLLGSIPFGYVLVRLFRGEDVRQSGSGNIGATNVARKSPVLGALTLLLDASKGFAAVAITRRLFPDRPALFGLAALIAIIGHMFPLWLGFHGGKGVATGLGSFVALVPKTILVMVAIFAAILFIFRYVALASILTAAIFPLLAWLRGPYRDAPVMLACMATASLLIIAKHHENISRLLAHTEPRFREKHS
jgi:glycerol-3-phosphate acyltransferase PlsY